MRYTVSYTLRQANTSPSLVERKVVTETAYGAARRAWWSMTDGERGRANAVRVVAGDGVESVWSIEGIRWTLRQSVTC
jgi:hypothetical protein